MVVHSGDADKGAKAWGDPELASYPSQVKVEKPEQPEPFAFAEDLHLATLPLELPKMPGVPSEAEGFAKPRPTPSPDLGAPLTPRLVASLPDAVEPAPDSSEAVTETRLEPPSISPPAPKALAPATISSKPTTPTVIIQSAVSQASKANEAKPSVARRRTLLSGVATVALLGLFVAVFAGREKKEALPVFAEEGSSAAVVAAPTAPAALVATPEPVTSAPVVTASPVASESLPQNVPSKGTVAPSGSQVVRVTITLTPSDSKLSYRGVAVAGPPFVVEVPKGKKLSLEASRKGFVTRKVTVDSTKTDVLVGLVVDKKHR
jgi:hypothetical protein